MICHIAEFKLLEWAESVVSGISITGHGHQVYSTGQNSLSSQQGQFECLGTRESRITLNRELNMNIK